ncbi:hypothetical protein GCM10027578_10850 [Spirosoma luteolum]
MKIVNTCLSVLFVIVCQRVGYADPFLVWPDAPNGRLYRIDVEKALLEAETKTTAWQTLGSVQMDASIRRELPPAARVTCLPDKTEDVCYFLVDCTQQVYRFDKRSRTLNRLDKTYYRGYNCFSVKFMRQDTIFSFGGYGFWHTNNILSYYKAAGREWESINPSTDSPQSIYRGFNGYIRKSDRFFSALSYRQNDSENKGTFTYADSVYAYLFKEKTWKRLGIVTQAVKKYLPADVFQKASWYQIDDYFVLTYYTTPFTRFVIVDPVKNEVRVWDDTNKLLKNENSEEGSKGEMSYVWQADLFFRYEPTATTGNAVQLIRFPIARLWKNGRSIGPFYEPVGSRKYNWAYLSVLAGLLVLGGTLVWFRKRQTETVAPVIPDSPVPVPLYPDSLTDKEKQLFDALLQAGPSEGLTTQRMNDILDLNDKSLDNQRKIRAEVIKGLNLKLKLQWNIAEAVERIPTKLDQRIFNYVLNEQVLSRIQNNGDNAQTESV